MKKPFNFPKIRKIDVIAFFPISVGAVITVFAPCIPDSIRVIIIILIGYLKDWIAKKEITEPLASIEEKVDKINKKTTKEQAALDKIIFKLLNHSKIPREAIMNKIKMQDEFLCIAKSDEGLSTPYEEKTEKNIKKKKEEKENTQLPFTKILHNLPNANRPFGNMGLFIIPMDKKTKKLVRAKGVKHWMNKYILKEVKKERRKYLKNIEEKEKYKDNCFKYIAFILKKESLEFDTKNRKFNDDFYNFLISSQSERTKESIKKDIEEKLKTEDILELVDWVDFIEFKKEQSEIMEKNKQKIFKSFRDEKIGELKALSKVKERDLADILERVLKKAIEKKETTKRKVFYISKTIIEESKKAVILLEEAKIKYQKGNL